jgi:hypothetical protein
MIAGTVLLCPTTSTTLPPWRTCRGDGGGVCVRVVRRSHHCRRQMEVLGEWSSRLDRAAPLCRDDHVDARIAERAASASARARPRSLSATSSFGVSAFSACLTMTTSCEPVLRRRRTRQRDGQSQRGDDRPPCTGS